MDLITQLGWAAGLHPHCAGGAPCFALFEQAFGTHGRLHAGAGANPGHEGA